MAGYIAWADLQAALGPQTALAIFDDTNAGSLAGTEIQITQVLTRAHARVVSNLPDIYEKLPAELPNNPVPALLADAELDYAVAYSLMRHPEYAKSYGDEDKANPAYKRAENTMKMVREAILRITDVPPETAPRNVGGHTVDNSNRIYVDNSDGTRNSGDF